MRAEYSITSKAFGFNSQNKEDLLSRFMSHRAGGDDSYNDKELRDVRVDFLLARRDTSAVTIAWFTYAMCRHSDIADKIHKEGVDVVGYHTDFESMAQRLKHEVLGRMHYLHAALSESLRLHPPLARVRQSIRVCTIISDFTNLRVIRFEWQDLHDCICRKG